MASCGTSNALGVEQPLHGSLMGQRHFRRKPDSFNREPEELAANTRHSRKLFSASSGGKRVSDARSPPEVAGNDSALQQAL